MLKAAWDHIDRDRRTFLPPVTDLFKAGDRVMHRAFGAGTILEVDSDDSCYIINFDRLETPRRITFRVKMERVTG